MHPTKRIYVGFIVLISLIIGGFAPVMDYITGEKSSVLEICSTMGIQTIDTDSNDTKTTPICPWCLAQHAIELNHDTSSWSRVNYASKIEWHVTKLALKNHYITRAQYARAPPLSV